MNNQRSSIKVLLRYIVVTFIISIALLNGTAFANDGGLYQDLDNRDIDAKIIPISEGIHIGEEYKFTLQLINKTSRPIKFRGFISMFYHDYMHAYDVRNTPKLDSYPIIRPYRTLSIECSMIVPQTLVWYESQYDKGYYARIQPFMYYDFADYPDGEEYPYEMAFTMSDPVHVPVLNLQDGSDFVDIQVDAPLDTVFYYPQFSDVSFTGDLLGTHYATVQLRNKTDQIIKKFFVPHYTFYDREEMNLYVDEYAHVQMRMTHESLDQNVPDEWIVHYTAIFKQDDQYYGVHIREDYPTRILRSPPLRIWVEDNMLQVQNLSQQNLYNLYVSEDYTSNAVHPENLIEGLAAGDTVSLPVYNLNKSQSINIGFVIEDYLHSWSIDYNSRLDNNYNSDTDNINISDIRPNKPIQYLPYPDQSPSPITDQPIKQMNEDTPRPTKVTTETTASSTQTSSNPKATASQTPTTVTMDHIQVEPIIPHWVWYVLIGVLVCAGIVIGLLRRKPHNT